MRTRPLRHFGAADGAPPPVPQLELAIIDLDNTLFDWVGFLPSALDAMVAEAATLLATQQDHVCAQLAQVHARYANIEQPFALLDIPEVALRYSGDPARAAAHLSPAFAAFDAARQSRLRPYPGVVEALEWLQEKQIRVAFYTDSSWVNAVAKLRQCGLLRFASLLIAQPYLESRARSRHEDFQDDPRLIILGKGYRKPNTDAIRSILRTCDAAAGSSVMIGDSIYRDIVPASHLGMRAIWARYGTFVDPMSAQRLWRYTHWQRVIEEEPQLPEHARAVDDPAKLLDVLAELNLPSD